MNRRSLVGLAAATVLASSTEPGDVRADGRDAAATPDLAFDRLLARYVRKSGDGLHRVDYRGWRAAPADLAALAGYVRALERIDPGPLPRAEQIAFWSNLYNAETLRVVLSAYPVGSILVIRPTLLSVGPWKSKTLRVAGRAMSLDDIENAILRPRFRDPLIHYALNCASRGCPNLPARAWRGADLERDLEAAARDFVNSPRGVKVTPLGLVLSSIYKWYRADFGGNDAAVLAHLARFASPKLRDVLEGRPRIARYDYDWRLNDVAAG